MFFDGESKLIKIHSIIEEIYGNSLHKKRQQSIAYAAMGILASESLYLHKIAERLIKTRGSKKKPATKQIDRLLSNKGISIWDLCASWVPYIIGNLEKITVALDWTSFYDDEEESMLSLHVVTRKGLSTPLLWKSVDKKQMKYNRARYEDELLSRFKEVLPAGMEVILLVDRNFTNPKFFRFLEEELKFQYIIRIKSSTTIIHGEKELKAREWLHPNGRIVGLKNPCITLQAYKISQFVAIKDKGMKSQWFLASNTTITPREIVTLYAKRWKIEPHFLDLKDNRYEWDWEWGQTHVKSCERRDKLMLLLALSYTLLIILGDAGEQIGFDEKLKVNTVKTRTHSLFRQGEFYYEFFFRFSQEEQDLLMEKFSDLLRKQDFWIDVLGDLK